MHTAGPADPQPTGEQPHPTTPTNPPIPPSDNRPTADGTAPPPHNHPQRHDQHHPQHALSAHLWQPALEAHALVGHTIHHYKILEIVGGGTFGDVYRARQTHPVHRDVALKILKPGMDSRAVLARFEAERHALARLSHPGVARVLDAGVGPGARPYFVMDFVRGKPITTHCDDQRDSIHQRIRLLAAVCDAVQHAHGRGIIHRDLKPDNVLVEYTDGIPTPRVIDFGVAKALSGRLGDQSLHTLAGALVGTPAYMAPEQADLTPQDIDTRADVYSLGIMLYQLLVGALPEDFPRSAGIDALRKLLKDRDPKPPRTRFLQLLAADPGHAHQIALRRSTTAPALARALRGDLDALAARCLEHDRSRRYPTADALAQDLRRFLDGRPLEAGPPTASYRARKLLRKHKGKAAAAAVAAASLVTATGVSSWFALAEARARRLADESHLRQLLTERSRLIAAIETDVNAGGTLWGLDTIEDLLAQPDPPGADDADRLDRVALRLARVEILAAWSRTAEVEAEVEHLLGAVTDGPHRAAILLWAGDIRMQRLSDTDDGAEFVRAALEHGGLSEPDRAYADGLLARTSTDAARAFADAVASDPYHHRARELLALTLMLSGHHEEARRQALIAQAQTPHSPAPLLTLATLDAFANRPEQALAHLEKLPPETNPRAASVVLLIIEGLSVARVSLGSPAPLDQFKRAVLPLIPRAVALSLKPPDDGPFSTRFSPWIREWIHPLNLGVMNLLQNRSLSLPPVETLKASFHANPERLTALLYGAALDQDGRTQQAIEILQLAQTLPSLLDLGEIPATTLGAYLLEQGATTDNPALTREGVRILTQSLQRLPPTRPPFGNAELFAINTKVALEVGDPAAARDTASAWLRRSPSEPRAHHWLAKVCLHETEPIAAVNHWRRALDLGLREPERSEALRGIETAREQARHHLQHLTPSASPPPEPPEDRTRPPE